MRDMAIDQTLVKFYERHGRKGDFNWGLRELGHLFIFNGLDVFFAFLSRDKIVVNFSNYYIIFLLLLNLNEKENIIQQKLIKK